MMRTNKKFGVFHLTTKQKQLPDGALTHQPTISTEAVVTGKSLCTQITVMEVVKKRGSGNEHALLLGQTPFILKCEIVFKASSLTTAVIKSNKKSNKLQLPPPPPSTRKVGLATVMQIVGGWLVGSATYIRTKL